MQSTGYETGLKEISRKEAVTFKAMKRKAIQNKSMRGGSWLLWRICGVGNDVCRGMIWGVDQGNCILSVGFLPIGPSHDFCQSIIPSWEDGVPKHTALHSLAIPLYTRFLPLDENPSRKVHKTKKLVIQHLLVWLALTGFKVIFRINDLLHLNWKFLIFFFFLP